MFVLKVLKVMDFWTTILQEPITICVIIDTFLGSTTQTTTTSNHNTNAAPTTIQSGVNTLPLHHHHPPHHHPHPGGNASTVAPHSVSVIHTGAINTSIPRHPSATIMTTASRHSRWDVYCIAVYILGPVSGVVVLHYRWNW